MCPFSQEQTSVGVVPSIRNVLKWNRTFSTLFFLSAFRISGNILAPIAVMVGARRSPIISGGESGFRNGADIRGMMWQSMVELACTFNDFSDSVNLVPGIV